MYGASKPGAALRLVDGRDADLGECIAIRRSTRGMLRTTTDIAPLPQSCRRAHCVLPGARRGQLEMRPGIRNCYRRSRIGPHGRGQSQASAYIWRSCTARQHQCRGAGGAPVAARRHAGRRRSRALLRRIAAHPQQHRRRADCGRRTVCAPHRALHKPAARRGRRVDRGLAQFRLDATRLMRSAHLQALSAVVEHRNFSLAARAQHMSQPTCTAPRASSSD